MSDKKFQIKESTKDGIAITVLGIGGLALIGSLGYCVKALYDMPDRKKIIQQEDKDVKEGKNQFVSSFTTIKQQKEKVKKDFIIALILGSIGFISVKIAKKLTS